GLAHEHRDARVGIAPFDTAARAADAKPRVAEREHRRLRATIAAGRDPEPAAVERERVRVRDVHERVAVENELPAAIEFDRRTPRGGRADAVARREARDRVHGP